jgi:RNA polymerase sigma-B factor
VSRETTATGSSASAPDDGDLELFRQFAGNRSRRLRNELVERHMGLAVHVAKRFGRNGRHDDDLRQVAMVGLVKSVERFDPDYGVSFTTFAGRTIEGELKRHFRDHSWSVKVPRSGKELHLAVRRAAAELEQRNGAAPSVDDIAEHLAIDRDDVLRGLAVSAAAAVEPIERPTDDGSATDRQSALAADDHTLDRVEDRHAVEQLLDRLPARERQIVSLRFYEEMTQSEIAEVVGVSQMQVSRLLRRSFEQMRMWADEPAT